jgi:hypothetical protein
MIAPPELPLLMCRQRERTKDSDTPIRWRWLQIDSSFFLQKFFAVEPGLSFEPKQDHAASNQKYSKPILHRQPFAKKQHGEDGNEHDTQLIDRRNFGGLADLQCAKITEPHAPMANPDKVRNTQVFLCSPKGSLHLPV